MRVALLAPRALPWHAYGGLERHVFDLARHLRRAGAEVDLFISTPQRDAAPFAVDPGFRLEIVPGRPSFRARGTVVLSRDVLYPLLSLRMGRRAAVAVKQRGIDAVVAQGLTGFGFAWWRERFGLRAPLVLNPQGMEESITPSRLKRAAYWPFRRLTRYAARRAERVVATDAGLVPVVESVFGVRRERIVVLPNAVDVAACAALADPARAAAVLARLDAGGRAPLLVTLGRLAPNKGLDVGLEALARLARELPRGWVWVVIGEGPMRNSIERRAAALGLSGNVRLAGALSDADAQSVLSTADLFLNPTLYEGSSLVTLEAMSHGRPIAATRAGGIPDKIVDGSTGWLAEAGNAAALADAIRRWLAAPEPSRRATGEAGRARCLERFDWPALARRYLALIAELRQAS